MTAPPLPTQLCYRLLIQPFSTAVLQNKVGICRKNREQSTISTDESKQKNPTKTTMAKVAQNSFQHLDFDGLL